MSFFGLTLDDVTKLLQIAAILYVIPASYYKFFKGRIYHLRLETSVSASLVRLNDINCLLINTSVKNVGIARANIDQRFTMFEIFSFEKPTNLTTIRSADWQHMAMYPALATHSGVEAGETISEQQLVAVAEGRTIAFKIELHVRSKKTTWISTTIIADDEKED